MSIPIPKFDIGDKVFRAQVEQREVAKQCPDCLGQGIWSGITPAGEEFEVPCSTCGFGFKDKSPGTIQERRLTVTALPLTIGSIRIDTASRNENPVSYMCKETGIGSGTIHHENNLFISEEEAFKRAREILGEREVELKEMDKERIAKKKKNKVYKPRNKS
jgi:hypothetical protein